MAVGDTRDDVNEGATEGTWGPPLLALAPALLIRIMSDRSGPWQAAAWTVWGLAAALTAAGWATAVRGGIRRSQGWATCLLLHVGLAVQALSLAS
ncbi:hypothetical protein I5Q34_32480 [Streptomyces sp. AV19]|uniref:hypothetical protein n=1 Tax=Streptomyces sp. AV19 TaxID=2793068 RepID=UPI0018FEBF27|nr:hypothetical protein [Streptomyces sp. AV19]MBH1938923.1 hypothetical protein [Streptomyces sp. AV19]MDG4533318.1 hypothetical protein [Streptomyces sp. AV19]